MTNLKNKKAADPKLIGPLFLIYLGITLFSGLSPFHAPENEVEWLRDGNGLRFSGYSSAVSAGTFAKDAGGNRTGSVEIWLRPASLDDHSMFLAFDGAEDGRVPLVLQQDRRRLLVRRNVVDQEDLAGTTLLKVESAFRDKHAAFVTLTLGKQDASVYVDGVLAKTVHLAQPVDDALTGRLVLANSPIINGSWSGQVYGAAIYHSELTPAEVAEAYQSWMKNRQPALSSQLDPVAIYLFNEGSGKVVRNQLDRRLDLTLPAQYFVLHKPFLLKPWRASEWNWSRWQDILINITGLVPFGFLLASYWSSVRPIRRPLLTTVIVGFLLSVAIECTQSLLPTRDSDMIDIITNTLGTLIGAWASRWLLAQTVFAETTEQAMALWARVSKRRIGQPSARDENVELPV